MIKAVAFDIDGTLIDSKQFILEAYRHTCTVCELEVIDEPKLTACNGASLRDTYARYHPEEDFVRLAKIHSSFQMENLHLCEAFADTHLVLDHLSQRKLSKAAITTRGTSVRATLDIAGIANQLDILVTGEDVRITKPDPEGMLIVLDHLKLRPDEIIMVGDMEADILLGKNTGIVTVGAAYGFSTVEQLQMFGADHIILSLADLIPLLDTLSG